MHLQNIENAMNTNNANIHKTAVSCSTSSTDSGVIIIDNKTTINNSNTKDNSVNKEAPNEYDKACDNEKSYNNTYKHSVNIENCSDDDVEIIIGQDNGRRQHQQSFGNTTTQHNCETPTISLHRRTSQISIVSIDENAIDSSVVDSDSDNEVDAEGVHSNYVVKKLGQQTTYSADSPDLPNINKGLTVISQKISPTVGGGEVSAGAGPLAENILNGSLCPPGNSSAQIGSIALTNSTDVTFGDKHFYEGPVTIQQFLIDSRDKWKANEEDGQDNPMFTQERNHTKEYENDVTPKANSPPTQQQHQPFIFNRKAVVITGTIIVLTILIGVLIVTTNNYFKNSIRKIEDDDDDYTQGTLREVSREDWNARPAKGVLDKLNLPVHRVIISHTASDTCDSKPVCYFRAQVIQNFHMDSLKWDDIGYNFLVGSDGRVYIGRGWDDQGAHTKGYNADSVGISFIGTFTLTTPTERQLEAAKLLIEKGVRLRKLAPDYRLYGARQLSGTESPGEALHRIIQTWPHWSKNI